MRSYDILDTPSEAEFEDIVKLAADICEVPFAFISFVDAERLWFKAKLGMAASEMPLTSSPFCAHAIADDGAVFIIGDTIQDPRFTTNPNVIGGPKYRFYAGAALETPDKLPLGMLCVLDTKPGDLSVKQRRILQLLAGQVMVQLELRKTLKQQKESEEQFRQLADTIPQLAWMADETGWAFWYNQRWYDYTGMSAEQMQGERRYDMYEAAEHTQVMQAWKQALATGTPYEQTFRIRRHDGQMRWFLSRAHPIMNAQGKVVRWFGTNTDIQEARSLEDTMRDKDARLATALQAGQMGTWELEVDGLVLSCSETCNINYGLAPDDFLTFERARDLVHHEDRARWMATIASAIDTAGDFEMEYRLVWPDGSLHWLYVRGDCTNVNHGRAARLSGVSINVTARKKLEMDAIEAQEKAEAANVAKTEFLANMSHEIRTPMNAVIGLSNILAKSKPLTEKQQDYIQTLQTSADSLLALINDLLDIAKIESHTVELEHIAFSIPHVVEQTISMMNVRAREKGLTFEVEQDCARIQGREVLGDPMRLKQILMNLCSNAIKFTERGSVLLHVSCPEIDNAAGRETIRIAVTDTGIGIPADKVVDIFQKFTQADSSISRKYGGTGLGLAITKTLAEVMGGTVELKSELGKGSTFIVSIPFELASEKHVAPFVAKGVVMKDETVVAAQQLRVLLVEDYEPNVLVAETFLESFGYAVDVASNGLEAIEKIKHNSYIATLMDVQMYGMSGLEATQIIRAHEKQHHKPRLHIIGMTAHALMGDRERCLAAGMDDYIAKPFNPDKLEEMLARLAQQRVAA